MVVEMNAAVQGIRVLFDFVKANKELAAYNDLIAALSEVNTELITSQAATVAAQRESLALQEKQFTFTQTIRELEEKIGQMEDWNSERECYELAEVTPGFFAYRLKPEMEANEIPHPLCANCFSKGEKSILQFERTQLYRRYCCSCCKTQTMV